MIEVARSSRAGVGTAIAHHGELLQGVFEDDHGRLHRGLVTLPLPRWISRATLVISGSREITTRPQGKAKAAAAARQALDHLKVAKGGNLVIESTTPEGHGYGSSTADVVATSRAVAAAYDVQFMPSRIGLLAVAAEKASDAVAFDANAVLFAQREDTVLEDFGGSLPPLLLVGSK